MAIGKKKFYDVEIPILNSNASIFASSPEEVEGKLMKYDLTRVLRGKNLVATLSIKRENEKLIAVIKSMVIQPSYIVKMIRKGISYIEDSFVCKLKEGKLRVKPFLITRVKVHRRVRTVLRNKCKEIIEYFAKDKTQDEFFSEVIYGRLQKNLSIQLKKIYPLSLCEIRAVGKEK